jgi:hypothetical protein
LEKAQMRVSMFVAAAAAVFVNASAFAQQPKPVRVSGTIEKVDGAILTIKTKDGQQQKVRLTEDAAVIDVAKATLADIKPNSFVGVGASPQPDGSQRAIRVVIFAESQRGLGEGHRPWDRPNTTMTNATVAKTVKGVEGPVLTVTYKGGEQKIIVPPEAIILANTAGNRGELVPGARVGIARAAPQPDGTFAADRKNVGRGGVVP